MAKESEKFPSQNNKIKTGIGLNRPDLQPECKTELFLLSGDGAGGDTVIARSKKKCEKFLSQKNEILTTDGHWSESVKSATRM